MEALRLEPNSQVAFVGSGGKTTAIFQLARQFEGRVLVTATTHLSIDQLKLADHHFILESPQDVRRVWGQLRSGVNLFTAPVAEQKRTRGVTVETAHQLHLAATKEGLPLLVEADGSRQRPLKAPAEYEPPIPDFINTIVVVVGLMGLGQILSEEHVHRPDIFSQMSGLEIGASITEQGLINVLLHPENWLRNSPSHARRIVMLNQAETIEKKALAGKIADQLLPTYHSVVLSSLLISREMQGKAIAVREPIAGIVLAGGEAKRMGKPKQLLLWKGETFVHRVTRTALQAGLAPVVVVTGAYAEEVEAAVKDLPVLVVRNMDWELGQSSSVKAGLRALPPDIGGTLFCLVDQPQIPYALIRSLLDEYVHTLAPIVAPQIDGERGNPVLFDRVTFKDFEDLHGDLGGRALFARYQVRWVPWLDSTTNMDVDTSQDYERLLGLDED
jgi:molybdenum cofactor cytidylyltransferase